MVAALRSDFCGWAENADGCQTCSPANVPTCGGADVSRPAAALAGIRSRSVSISMWSQRWRGLPATVQTARIITAVQAASSLVMCILMIWLALHGPPVVHDGCGSWCGLGAGLRMQLYIGIAILMAVLLLLYAAPLTMSTSRPGEQWTVFLLVEALTPACIIIGDIVGNRVPTWWQVPFIVPNLAVVSLLLTPSGIRWARTRQR